MNIEISDNKLSGLLLVAILMSGFMLLNLPRFELAGKITDTASTTTTVSPISYINFSEDSLSWGTGSVSLGAASCRLNTTGDTTNCTGFTTINTPLVVENTGNTNISVDLMSNVSAAQFIGGSGPQFQYFIEEAETDACLSNIGSNCNVSHTGNHTPKTLTGVNPTNPGTRICPCLLTISSKDSLNVHLQMLIPDDAPSGSKSALLVATGTSI